MRKINSNTIVAAVSLLFIITLISSCYYDNQEELHPNVNSTGGCDTTGVLTYTKNIAPIMIESCGANNLGCHQVSTSSNFNIGLNSYADIIAIDTTQLMSSINQDGKFSKMPKGANKLAACQIAIIQKWVNTGKQN